MTDRDDAGRLSATTAGLRLAFTTFTVAPVQAGRIDRASAAVAMAVAPAIGAVLGLPLAGILWLLREAHVPALVAGAVTVAGGALLTRGMHLDGLADTVDALGSYRRGAAALSIMKKSDIGPFGVAAIALVLLIQAAALSTLSPWAVVAAFAIGRCAVTVACRRGVPAARPEGLGALVAGTIRVPVAALIAIVVAGAAAAASPDRLWLGPATVATALVAVLLLLHHAVRRFGGITGDVLGACVELATTIALVGFTVG